jgi:hypothetical protein
MTESSFVSDDTLSPQARQAHDEAVARGDTYYIDPTSGLLVFTELYLLQRPCCLNGCRHCPYGFAHS